MQGHLHMEGRSQRPKMLAKPQGVGGTPAERWTAAYGITPRRAGICAHSSLSQGQNWKPGPMKPLQRARKQPLSITKLRLPQVVPFVGGRTAGRIGRDFQGTQRSQEVHGPQGAIWK